MVDPEHFYELVEHSLDGISLAAENGKIIYVNSALCKLVQRSAEEIIQGGRAILFPEDYKKLADGVRIRDEKGAVRGELEIIDSKGTIIPVEVSSVSYTDDANIRYYATIIRDIRERKAMEAELLESRNRFQALSDSSFEGIIIHIDGTVREANNTMAAMFGYQPGEMIGLTAEDLVIKECAAMVRERIRNNYEKPYQATARKKNGKTFPIEVCGKATIYKGQKARITSFRDITDKLTAEKEIKRYETKFQTLLQNGSDMLGLLNDKGEYVYIAPSVERILGYKPHELVGKSALDFVHPDDVSNVISKLNEVLNDTTVKIPDFRFRHANGHYLWIETVLDNMLNNKYVKALSASSRDITQRKLAEIALQQREADLKLALENMRTIFNYSMDMICTIDADDRFVDVSPSCEQILGYTANELRGRYAGEFVVDEDRKITREFANRIRSGQTTINFENRCIHKSGKIVDLMWSAKWAENTHIVFCIARDITERKLAMREIKINEQKFRSLFEQNPDAVFSIDSTGIITSANNAFTDIMETPVNEVVGQHVMSFFNVVGNDEIQHQMEMVLSGKANTFISQFTNRNGQLVKVRATVLPIIVDGTVTGAYCVAKDITESWQNEQRLLAIKRLLEKAVAPDADIKQLLNIFLKRIEELYGAMQCNITLIENNKLQHYVAPSIPESRASFFNDVRIPDMERLRMFLPLAVTDVSEEPELGGFKALLQHAGLEAFIAYPLLSSAGEITGIFSFNYRDKSRFSEKHIEIISQLTRVISMIMDNRNSLENIKRQNKELQKINTELDRFAYSTSHELRAPLTSIKGLITLAMDEAGCTKEVFDYLKMIEQSTINLEKFILEIGEYYRNKSTTVHYEPVHLHNLVNESISRTRQLQDAEDMNFDINIDPDLYVVSDPQRLDIMLGNLLDNAIKYSDDTKPGKFVNISAAKKDESVEITVEDNGIGIPKQCLPKICNMFYRGADSTKGSGLGLYIVREVVDRLKGKMEIQSKEGKGTCVKLLLPANTAFIN